MNLVDAHSCCHSSCVLKLVAPLGQRSRSAGSTSASRATSGENQCAQFGTFTIRGKVTAPPFSLKVSLARQSFFTRRRIAFRSTGRCPLVAAKRMLSAVNDTELYRQLLPQPYGQKNAQVRVRLGQLKQVNGDYRGLATT